MSSSHDKLTSPADYYRQRQIALLKSAMQYGEAEYAKDWEMAIAIAQIMAVQGDSFHLEAMLSSIFERLEAYYSIWHRLPAEPLGKDLKGIRKK